MSDIFLIISGPFRCLLTTMQQHPDNINLIIMCVCVLHNLILTRYPFATYRCGPWRSSYTSSDTWCMHGGPWHGGLDASVRPQFAERGQGAARLFVTLLFVPCWRCSLARKNVHPMNRIHMWCYIHDLLCDKRCIMWWFYELECMKGQLASLGPSHWYLSTETRLESAAVEPARLEIAAFLLDFQGTPWHAASRSVRAKFA